MYICNHVYIHPTRRDFVLWISIHFFWGNMWHSSQTRNLPGTTKTIVQWPFNLRKHIPNWSELDRYPIGKKCNNFWSPCQICPHISASAARGQLSAVQRTWAPALAAECHESRTQWAGLKISQMISFSF